MMWLTRSQPLLKKDAASLSLWDEWDPIGNGHWLSVLGLNMDVIYYTPIEDIVMVMGDH
jgi:hypothetical protein